jgi:transposase
MAVKPLREVCGTIHPNRRSKTQGLGRCRWVVERTFAWLNQFRRLRVRYEKRADLHEALLSLGCALIRWNALLSGPGGLRKLRFAR